MVFVQDQFFAFLPVFLLVIVLEDVRLVVLIDLAKLGLEIMEQSHLVLGEA